MGKGGGASEVLPLQKEGKATRSFSHPEGGCTQRFGVVLTQVLEVLTILEGGGHKRFPLFKREGGGGGVRSVILF